MKKSKSRSDQDEVIAGGKESRSPRRSRGDGHDAIGAASIEHWEQDFGDMPWFNKIKEIMNFPSTEDMAGVMARSIFKNDRERIAVVRLSYRHKRFKDNDHQEMLREWLASKVGERGLGRLDQLFAATNLIAPDMYRTVMGMPRNREKEKVTRSSDFRERREGEEQE